MSNAQKITHFTIPAAGRLDPIEVFTYDMGQGKGKLLIECFGLAWSCYWGAMRGGFPPNERDLTVLEFVGKATPSYLTECLEWARANHGTTGECAQALESQHLERICKVLVEHVRAGKVKA